MLSSPVGGASESTCPVPVESSCPPSRHVLSPAVAAGAVRGPPVAAAVTGPSPRGQLAHDAALAEVERGPLGPRVEVDVAVAASVEPGAPRPVSLPRARVRRPAGTGPGSEAAGDATLAKKEAVGPVHQAAEE